MKTSTVLLIIALVILPVYFFSKQAKSTVLREINFVDYRQTGKTKNQRRNNPLNMRPGTKTYLGQTGSEGNFIVFETWQHGIAAAIKLLRVYVSKGVSSSCSAVVGKPQNTVYKIINVWAPSSSCGGDNTPLSVANYVSFVAGRTGFGQNNVIDVKDFNTMFGLVSAMSRMEIGFECVTKEQFSGGWKIANEVA